MNFDLGPDERALQDAIREMCARHFALEDLRARGMNAERWAALDEAGIFTLRVPEQHGGLGLGMTHAAIAFEQLGRSLVPGPVLETHLGRARGATETVIVVVERGAATIDHLEQLDVVAVIDADGLWRVAPADVRAEPIEPRFDPFTPQHQIRSMPRGEKIAGPSIAVASRLEGAVLTAAFLVGIAAETTDLAVAYAQQREQFGRPIGRFQAVKHLCADMAVRGEVARAAVYAAACLLDEEAGTAARATAGAKLLANEAAGANAKAAIQVHGGMGYTWEMPLHLYLKRAAVLAARFGTTHEHEEAVAATL